MQRPGFHGEENKLGQKNFFLKKMAFSLAVFTDENNIVNLVVDMLGNCSNRLSIIVQLNSKKHEFQKQLSQKFYNTNKCS